MTKAPYPVAGSNLELFLAWHRVLLALAKYAFECITNALPGTFRKRLFNQSHPMNRIFIPLPFISAVLIAVSLSISAAAATHLATCDEANLRAAIAQGGAILFDCDGIIALTNTLVRTSDVRYSFPALVCRASNTSSPFLKSTVTRLRSVMSPARSLRESAVSSWRCRKRLSGRAP